MKNTVFYLLILGITGFLGSCNSGNKSLLPNSIGVPYEILVVIDNQIWDDEAGRNLYNELDQDIPFLPQPEPSFRISHTDAQHFDSQLKPVRNIIQVEISPIIKRVSFTAEANRWANNQMVMTIKAPDSKSLSEALIDRKGLLCSFFNKQELNRAYQVLLSKHNSDILRTTKKVLNVEVFAPSDIQYTKIGKDFIWASNQGNKGRSDIVIYSVPYKRIDAFSKERLLQVRDSVLKINIPGSSDGSYMATEYRAPIVTDTIAVNGKFCVQLAGLWQMTNDMMGGPFISQSRLDEKNQRIITIEGFVFAPEMKKRNLIRRLEAILYTLKLPGEKSAQSLLSQPGIIKKNSQNK